jgi:tetratricopeptide (TPR) repeat protein
VALSRGEPGQSAKRFHCALESARQTGNLNGEAYALNNLGCAEMRLRHNGRAADLQARALAIFERFGDRTGQALTLEGLGTAHAHLGRLGQAIGCLEQALSIAREIGGRRTEPTALNSLGEVNHAAGSRMKTST